MNVYIKQKQIHRYTDTVENKLVVIKGERKGGMRAEGLSYTDY